VEIAQRVRGDAMKPERGASVAARSQVDHGFHQLGLRGDQPDERPRTFLHRTQNIQVPHRGVTVSQFKIARFAQPPFDGRKRGTQRIAERAPGRMKRLRVGHVIGKITARPSVISPARRKNDQRVGRFQISQPGPVAEINFAGALAKTFLERDGNALPGSKITGLALIGRTGPGRLFKQTGDLFDVHKLSRP
jgi:hypothetical protein